ncbi:MAG: hypothetical protein K6G38_06300 [Gammaproteobacteria bacterium]|nr:hypothetical protein [Gammaproteobacteria bacterium]
MAVYIDKNIYVGDTGVQLSALGEIANKAPKSHASSGTTYGVGTTSNYGHCRVINNLTTSSATNGYALQAYQGKLINDRLKTLEQDSGWIYAFNYADDNYARYRKKNGIVYVQCHVKGGTTIPADGNYKTILTLPEGYRSDEEFGFTVNFIGGPWRNQSGMVYKDGRVAIYIASDSSQYYAFHITFPV